MKNNQINRIYRSAVEVTKPVFNYIISLHNRTYPKNILLILPVCFVLITSIVHEYYGDFYLHTIDPEYFHTYNGIAIADGNLAVQYIAHPGTPLEYTIAVAARIIHPFQPEENLIKDFVNNPEKYIRAANLLLNILAAFGMFIMGFLVFKYTKSSLLALVAQLLPFSHSSLLLISGRLIPEASMIFPLLFASAVVVKNAFLALNQQQIKRDLIAFAIIIGYGIACKLSFLPIFLIPLLLYKTSIRRKLVFMLYSAVFIAIFAYPIVINFGEFSEWFSGVFTESARHNADDTFFIDFSTVPGNFMLLFREDVSYFIIMLTSLVTAGLFSLKPVRKKLDPDQNLVRAILVINLVILACIFVTLKRFAIHYFMPFYVFKYLLILLSGGLFLKLQKILETKLIRTSFQWFVLLLVLVLSFGESKEMRISLQNLAAKQERLLKWEDQIKSLMVEGQPMILTGPYYGSPFIEFAHHNGFLMTFQLAGEFKKPLQQKFPTTLHYVDWAEKFYFWGDLAEVSDIIDSSSSKLYVYIGENQQKHLSEIKERVFTSINENLSQVKTLYENETTGEELIEITLPCDSVKKTLEKE